MRVADALKQISVLLRSAKLRLTQAEELVAASGVVDTKADTGKALSYIESALRKVEDR
jgi:hypothetical protein